MLELQTMTYGCNVPRMTGGPPSEIRAAIEKVVATQLAPAQVVDLIVTEDEDSDGDPIFNIVVVFKAEDGSA